MVKKTKAKKARVAKKSGAKKAKTRTSGRKRSPVKSAARKTARRNGNLDEGLRQTFPSSDPPTATNPTRSIKQ
jgi:hypothetical protein